METQNLDLADVPGLGPVRRAALQEAGVRDLSGLLALKAAELAAIRGIGQWQAQKIREFLRQRGLVVAEDADGSAVVAVHTPAEAAAVAESVRAMQAQAEAEARIEAEVEALAEAVAEAQRTAEAPGPDQSKGVGTMGEAKPRLEAVESAAPPAGADSSLAAEGIQFRPPLTQRDGVGAAASGEPEDAAQAAETEDEATVEETLSAQREQIPETALALMDGIRQAAVSRQLTRQLTRLLILAGEFDSASRPVSEKQQERASSVLARVEGALQGALERQAFGPKEQLDLARRIRRRRKELEAILEKG